LLEFLENEKPGWESSIGKVIGRDLLLRDDLNPKIEEGNNIYGLKLQLQDVETIKISKKELESELYKNQLLQNTNNKEIAKHQQQIQNKRDKLTQKFSKKIVEVSEKIKLKTYEFHHTETAIEKNIISRNQINEKAGIKKNKEILKLENEKHKIETQFNESIKILKQINEFEDKAIQELKKQLKAKEKEFTQQLVSITANVQSQISTLELELERQLKDIETLRNSTLKKKGVDTLKLHSIESIITELNRKLEEINENYKTIIEYQKDCKEYIYKLNDFRRNRKELEEEIQHKESLFKKRLKSENEIHEKHNTDYKKIGITLEDNTRQVESMQRFAKEILYEELKSYLEHHDKFEAEACDTLIERLKNLAIEHQKKDKQLIERITEFSGFFNQNNCLGFEITVNSDEQYRAFAIILKNL
ncbi:MAG: ATP-binding protein, partial [Bacteroidota bacterium]|nr:ATP-binding protein [Bacteroidota bacterium]